MPFCQMSHAEQDCSKAFGKRPGRSFVNAAGNPHKSSSLAIFERNSGRHFLIDSGADESVIPATHFDRHSPQSAGLVAANGTPIRTYGRRTVPISFSSHHHVHHPFWIADVAQPLLGADFFRDNHLLIDIPRRRLIDRTGFTYPASLSSAPSICGLRLPAAGP